MNEPTTVTVDDHAENLKVIHIHGDLDSMGAQMVEESFTRAIADRGNRVVVNLADVSFVSSAGMALLLVKGKMLRRGGGNMFLASASDRVKEVLSLAGFQELFDLYPDVDAALASLADD